MRLPSLDLRVLRQGSLGKSIGTLISTLFLAPTEAGLFLPAATPYGERGGPVGDTPDMLSEKSHGGEIPSRYRQKGRESVSHRVANETARGAVAPRQEVISFVGLSAYFADSCLGSTLSQLLRTITLSTLRRW